jgi:hypothetical protein
MISLVEEMAHGMEQRYFIPQQQICHEMKEEVIQERPKHTK